MSRHPRLVVGSAVGAIVLLGVAIGLVMGIFGPQPTGEADATPTVQPTPSIQPTDGPSSSPSSTPTAASGGPVITWSEQSFEGSVDAVTADSGQFVAVGKTAAGLAAWMSPDGVTWGLHPVPQPRPDQILPNFPGDQSQFLNLVGMGPLARLGDTLYSFGTFGGFIDFIRPLGWRSADGTQWEFIESENEFFAYGSIRDLAASDTGLLAARGGGFGQFAGGAWLWTPETSWTATGLASSPGSSITILDLAWNDSGFIAVGLSAQGDPSTDSLDWPVSAASWISIDGKTWQQAPPSSSLDQAIMWAVSPMPVGGFVAVGCVECSQGHPGGAGYGDPAAWTSPDGVNWTQLPVPSGGVGEALGVLPVQNGFLAVGAVGEDTVTWTSSDGSTWRAGPTLPGRFQPKTLVTRDDSVMFILIRGEQAGLPETVLMLGEIQP
jgi:hypothetical protein